MLDVDRFYDLLVGTLYSAQAKTIEGQLAELAALKKAPFRG